MTLKAVLIDLDDTLVHIDTELFTRHYIDLIATFVAERFPSVTAEQFKKVVVGATRQVSRNLDPMRLNRDVINNAIAAALPIQLADMDAAFVDFFNGPYRTLSSLATPISGSRELVDWLLAHNIIVVIATNPLFISQATYERVRWAELDPDNRGLALITTADNSHFTKPNIAYYSEILAKIGVDPAQALMVGDSLDNDIQPALAAGLNAYWTMPNKTIAVPASIARFGTGSLTELIFKLNEGWLSSSEFPSTGSPIQVTAWLTASVAALDSLLKNKLPDEPRNGVVDWPLKDPVEFTTPKAVVAYWAQLEATFNQPTLERIVNDNNPFIEPPSPFLGIPNRTIYDLRNAFSRTRAETLFFLATLGVADWNRPARDAVFGPTTLLDMANLIQRQDRQLLACLNALIYDNRGVIKQS